MSANSVTSMAWSAAMSRKTWVVPLVGQWISRTAIRAACARPMVCCERVRPEAAARRDVPVDGQRLLPGRDNLDPGADGRPIGLLADELDGQPVVPLAGILKEDVVILSPWMAPPISMKRSMSPSRSQSPQATPCPFCRWPVPEDAGDLGEALAAHVLEHPVGDEARQVGIAGAQVHVQEAVVVEIAEIAAHGREDHVQTGLPWSRPRSLFRPGCETACWTFLLCGWPMHALDHVLEGWS